MPLDTLVLWLSCCHSRHESWQGWGITTGTPWPAEAQYLLSGPELDGLFLYFERNWIYLSTFHQNLALERAWDDYLGGQECGSDVK